MVLLGKYVCQILDQTDKFMQFKSTPKLSLWHAFALKTQLDLL